MLTYAQIYSRGVVCARRFGIAGNLVGARPNHWHTPHEIRAGIAQDARGFVLIRRLPDTQDTFRSLVPV